MCSFAGTVAHKRRCTKLTPSKQKQAKNVEVPLFKFCECILPLLPQTKQDLWVTTVIPMISNRARLFEVKHSLRWLGKLILVPAIYQLDLMVLIPSNANKSQRTVIVMSGYAQTSRNMNQYGCWLTAQTFCCRQKLCIFFLLLFFSFSLYAKVISFGSTADRQMF